MFQRIHLAFAFALAAVALCGAATRSAPTPDPGIPSTLNAYVSGWNHADAHAIAEQFAADGDLINSAGAHARGPSEVEAYYRAAFARGYAGSIVRFSARTMRPLRADLVAVDGVWSIEGVRDLRGNLRPVERGRAIAFLERRGGSWRVALLREE